MFFLGNFIATLGRKILSGFIVGIGYSIVIVFFLSQLFELFHRTMRKQK